MLWIIFAVGAALAWGLYGPALHQGQVQLGSPLRALLCVGVAYFLIGVLVPVIALSYQGELHGFNMKGSMAATIGGALGAIGAVCIIFAFRAGGLPTYVMPLVFAGAPLVNVLFRCGCIRLDDSNRCFISICFSAAGRTGFVFQTCIKNKQETVAICACIMKYRT